MQVNFLLRFVLGSPIAMVAPLNQVVADGVRRVHRRDLGLSPTSKCWALLQCFTENKDLWLGTINGLYRSVNHGKSWDFVRGLGEHSVKALLEGGDGEVYAGCEDGIRVSGWGSDYQHWVRVVESRLGVHSLYEVRNGDIYAGTGSGFLRSVDHGRSWKTVLPQLMWDAFLQTSNGDIYAASNYGLRCSTDQGKTWDVSIPSVGFASLFQCDWNEEIFAGGGMNGGLWCASGHGEHWGVVPGSRFRWSWLSLLEVKKKGYPLYLLAGTDDGLVRSGDRGEIKSWRVVLDFPHGQDVYVRALLQDPVSGNIFAATDDSGLFVSADLGKNWSRISA